MAAGQAPHLNPPAPAVPMVQTTHDPAMAALLACLHQDPQQLNEDLLAGLGEQDWQRLLALAAAHGIRGLIGHRLSDASVAMRVPTDVQQNLNEAGRQTAARMLRAQAQIAELTKEFAATSIPVMALKGAHLAQAVYPGLTLRAMQDIDLLVPRQDLERATEIALTLDYTPIRPFTVEQEAAQKAHVTRLVRPDSLDMEIHWNITAPNEIYAIDPADLWTRAVPVEFSGCRALGLSPEHLLLHLCAHASYQHGFEFGIRSLVDLATIIRRFGEGLDWAIIERQCRAWGWQRGVVVSLSLTRELFGAAIPGDVLDSLAADTGGTALDRDVIATARVQILGEPHLYAESHYFAQFRTLPGFWPKARHAWGRVFLPRSEMARLHGENLDSGGSAALYVARAFTLLGRYARSTVGILKGGGRPHRGSPRVGNSCVAGCLRARLPRIPRRERPAPPLLVAPRSETPGRPSGTSRAPRRTSLRAGRTGPGPAPAAPADARYPPRWRRCRSTRSSPRAAARVRRRHRLTPATGRW